MSDDHERDEMRDYARSLFGAGEQRNGGQAAIEEIPSPTPDNHVPGEGNNPRSSNGDAPMREFVAALFANANID